jgi:hypothetical protein
VDLVERIIPADETVLYEGRARGFPSLGPTVMLVSVILAFGACLAMVGSGITVSVNAVTVKVPIVVSLLVAQAGFELYRFASWRSARYVITARRVLAIKGVFWQSVQFSARRVGYERARPAIDGIEIIRLDEALWLALVGLPTAEVASIDGALASFDPTPPALPPPPFWSSPRMAVAALFVLCVVIAAVVRAFP